MIVNCYFLLHLSCSTLATSQLFTLCLRVHYYTCRPTCLCTCTYLLRNPMSFDYRLITSWLVDTDCWTCEWTTDRRSILLLLFQTARPFFSCMPEIKLTPCNIRWFEHYPARKWCQIYENVLVMIRVGYCGKIYSLTARAELDVELSL